MVLDLLLIGAPEIKRLLTKASKQADEIRTPLRQLGEEIMASAKLITPHKSGRLKGSGFVRVVGPRRVDIGFGTDYAFIVHESFAKHKAPTTRKFLEGPAKARLDKTDAEIKLDPLLSKIISFERGL